MLGHNNNTPTATTATPAYGAGVPGAVPSQTSTNTTHGSGGGISSKIPGTDAYKAAHGQPVNHAAGTTPTHAGAPVAAQPVVVDSHDKHHGKHGKHETSQTVVNPSGGTTTTTTTTTHKKPGIGDKISGKMDQMVGKMSHNEAKVAKGSIREHEGKQGLDAAAIAYANQGGGAATRH